jgi:hypothetical protein
MGASLLIGAASALKSGRTSLQALHTTEPHRALSPKGNTMITLAQIHAAQNSAVDAEASPEEQAATLKAHLDGIRAVLDEMNGRIDRLASQTASGMATNPARYTDYVNDFRQDAMVTLFEYLPRWQGDSVDEFRAYLYGAISGDLKAKAHAERNPGADRDAVSVFKAMVELAEGDVYKAEKLAQTVPPKGKRISADRANAARLAWQGAVSIDKTSDDDDESSIMHTLAVTDETPQVSPKVGHGAALEALAVLHRYSSAREALSALPAKPEDVDAIEDAVKVPRDESERRYVLDAVAILRSYVSTATDGDLIEELREVADERKDERAAKNGMVHAVLDDMSKRAKMQRDSLVMSFGIGGALCFGTGDSGDLDGLAEAMGVSYEQARLARVKGFKGFAKRFIALAAGTEAEAIALNEAATDNLSRGGRK